MPLSTATQSLHPAERAAAQLPKGGGTQQLQELLDAIKQLIFQSFFFFSFPKQLFKGS